MTVEYVKKEGYWLASGYVWGVLFLAEGDTRAAAVADWRALVRQRVVV